MKKVIVAVLAVSAAVAFTSCGSSSKIVEPTPPGDYVGPAKSSLKPEKDWK